MASPNDIRVRELLTEALARPTEERLAFLDEGCGGDAALRAEVAELLLGLERAGGFFSDATVDQPDRAAATTLDAAPLSEAPGARIGRYKLLQLIGEGGFGSVFMAEQEQPVRRRVALKIIKLGMDTRQVIARFDVERQALAMMDHPNIAKILDAGATATGRPYFVMELVKGVPITQYCDSNKLATQARLELFIAVCNALQHAHQKGIIHRDIKPSNVLVTLHDGKPVPMLIDFGIAKATQSRLTEKTLFTEFRQMIGTPAYMSPEQAEMSGLDIDTRSDIYSLGVLLYELLTGTTPFDPRELGSAAYGEIQRIIREVDPPKPSTRLSTLGAPLTGIAANRGIDGRKLGQLVRGELDWIVMKSLEKDRTRRYESAGDLARDVGRHLGDEPVEACPPGASYRLRKFVKRNRATVSIALAVLTVAVTAIALYVHGIRVEQHKTELALSDARTQRAEAEKQKQTADQQRAEAEKQKQAADHQRDEAQKQERIATSINDFLTNMLTSADPNKLFGDKVTVVQAIEGAVKQLDAGGTKMDPATEAHLRSTIGSTLEGLGRYDEAEPQLRKALAIRRQAMPGGRRQVVLAMGALAHDLLLQQKLKEVEALYREALAIDRKELPAGDPGIARSLNVLGNFLTGWKSAPEAETLLREALAINRKALPEGDRAIADTLHHLAWSMEFQQKPAEAESIYREAIATRRKNLPSSSPELVVDLQDLSVLMMNRDRDAEAEPLVREALSIRRKMLPAGHPDIADSLRYLSSNLGRQGKLEETEKLFRESLEIDRKALPADHHQIAMDLTDVGKVLAVRGDWKGAESMFREALPIARKTAFTGPPYSGETYDALTRLLIKANRPAEAESVRRDELKTYRESPLSNPNFVAVGGNDLGALLTWEGKYAEAEPLLRETLTVDQKLTNHKDTITRTTAAILAVSLEKTGRGDEAKALRKAHGIPARTTSPTTQTAETQPAGAGSTTNPDGPGIE